MFKWTHAIQTCVVQGVVQVRSSESHFRIIISLRLGLLLPEQRRTFELVKVEGCKEKPLRWGWRPGV